MRSEKINTSQVFSSPIMTFDLWPCPPARTEKQGQKLNFEVESFKTRAESKPSSVPKNKFRKLYPQTSTPTERERERQSGIDRKSLRKSFLLSCTERLNPLEETLLRAPGFCSGDSGSGRGFEEMPKKLVLGIKRGFGFRKILVKVQIRSPLFLFGDAGSGRRMAFLGLAKGGEFYK